MSKPILQKNITILGRRVFSDVPLQQDDLVGKYLHPEQRIPLVDMLKEIEKVTKAGTRWADFYYVEGKMSAKPRPMKRKKEGV